MSLDERDLYVLLSSLFTARTVSVFLADLIKKIFSNIFIKIIIVIFLFKMLRSQMLN